MTKKLAQVLDLEDGRAAVFQQHERVAELHDLHGPVDLVDADGPAFVLGRERVVALLLRGQLGGRLALLVRALLFGFLGVTDLLIVGGVATGGPGRGVFIFYEICLLFCRGRGSVRVAQPGAAMRQCGQCVPGSTMSGSRLVASLQCSAKKSLSIIPRHLASQAH